MITLWCGMGVRVVLFVMYINILYAIISCSLILLSRIIHSNSSWVSKSGSAFLLKYIGVSYIA